MICLSLLGHKELTEVILFLRLAINQQFQSPSPLLTYQNSRIKGFCQFKSKDKESRDNPFLTLHVGHCLAMCRKHSIPIPFGIDEKIQSYFNSHINEYDDLDTWTSVSKNNI